MKTVLQDKDDTSGALSVSAALAIAKEQLEGIVVRVLGEVSELSNKAGYKAVYFTIKDKSASLPCMMWVNRYASAGIELKVGMLVEVTGRFSLYAAKGRMNFDVFSIALAGEGELRMQVADLARRLRAEGLMDASTKLAIPKLPCAIGLVTSPRGAAVYDVLRTLRRRYPLARVVVAGVPVEGSGAAAALIEGLHAVYEAGVEVALLVRGGGSFEDLMPFNDEGLARTIAALPIPVVTGIGHEPDTSIADMVAALRASTPTAAAEAIAPSVAMISSDMVHLRQRLQHAEQVLMRKHADTLMPYTILPIFKDPMRLFAADSQKLDDLSFRLETVLPGKLSDMRNAVDMVSTLLKRVLPDALDVFMSQFAGARSSMEYIGRSLVEPHQKRLALASAMLESLSPLAVLRRGYAIAHAENGEIIKSARAAEPDQDISVQVQDGVMECTIAHVKLSDLDQNDQT